jgi:glycosyltransferase involved in cell wall biosynthesis
VLSYLLRECGVSLVNSILERREAAIAASAVEGNPLRIALVHTSDQGGGAEASTYLLLCALRELGHQVTLHVGTKRGTDPDVREIPRPKQIPGVLRVVKWYEDWTGRQFTYLPGFRQLDKVLGDVDVVHYHSLWSRQGFAEVTALPRLTALYPSLMTLRDWWMITGHCAHPAPGCERWKSGCGQCPDLNLAPAIKTDGTAYNFSRKQSAISRSQLCVTTVSQAIGDEVRQSPIFANKQIHTVHNGIDETAFYPRERRALRQQLGLPLDQFIVLLAGQSVEGFGLSYKAAGDYALESLTASGVQPYILAIGRSAEKLRQQWPGPGIAIPFQSDPQRLAEYYCAADVVLAASLWESFGRVPAEAHMCGIPVVAFATGGIPEIVEDKKTGLLVERLNSPALGAAVRELAQSEETRLAMGMSAAVRARSLFSNRAISLQFVEHYRAEIVARRLAGGSR